MTMRKDWTSIDLLDITNVFAAIIIWTPCIAIATTSRSPDFSLSVTLFNLTHFIAKRVIPGRLQVPTSSACSVLRRAFHTSSQHTRPHCKQSGMHFALTFVHHRETNPPAWPSTSNCRRYLVISFQGGRRQTAHSPTPPGEQTRGQYFKERSACQETRTIEDKSAVCS
jgi:hypothetical protein